MGFFSISSPNLSLFPPKSSKKMDAENTNTAYSIGSVPNSATTGIQGTRAVSKQPSSAWHHSGLPWNPKRGLPVSIHYYLLRHLC